MKKIVAALLFSIIFIFTAAADIPVAAYWHLLSEMRGLHPDIIAFDPVYDSENRLTGYDFSGIIKIHYLPVGSASPEIRRTTVWNRFSNEYTTMEEIRYGYDSTGRLTEEITYNAAHGTDSQFRLVPGYTISYGYELDGSVETTIYTYKLGGDENGGSLLRIPDEVLDETGLDEDEPVFYPYGKEEISIKEVRFLSDAGHPDSIHYYHDEILDGKIHCRHDGQGRIVELEAFQRIDGMDSLMHLFYRVDFEYTDLTVKQTYRSGDGQKRLVEWAPENGIWYDDEFMFAGMEEPAYLFFEFDDNGRLLEKRFDLGEVNVLTTIYSYESGNRQSVDARYNLEPFLQLSNDGISSSAVSMLSDGGLLIIKGETDESGVRSTRIVALEPEADEPSGVERTIAEIAEATDAEGRTTMYDLTRFYQDGEMKERELTLINYGTEADGTTWQEVTVYSIDEPDEHIYENGLLKKLTKYDSGSRLTYCESFDFDDTTLAWIPGRMSERKYDDWGYLSYEKDIYYHRNSWKGSKSSEYVNDSAGRILTEKDYRWAEGKWFESARTTYEYNENGRKTQEESMEFSTTYNEWRGIYKRRWDYDAEGNTTLKENYRWAGGRWNPYESEVSTYDDGLTATTRYVHKDGKRVPDYKTSLYINHGSDSSLRYYTTMSWDSDTSDWVVTYHTSTERSNNLTTEIDFDWDPNEEKLYGSSHKTTFTEDNTKVETYKIWDGQNEVWVDFLRYTEIDHDYRPDSWSMEPTSDKTYLYETFDADSNAWHPAKMFRIVSSEYEADDSAGENENEREMILWITELSEYIWDIDSRCWLDHSYCRSLENYYGTAISSEYFSCLAGEKYPQFKMESDGPMLNIATYSRWDSELYLYVPIFKNAGKGWRYEGFIWDAENADWKLFDFYDYPASGEWDKIKNNMEYVQGLFEYRPEDVFQLFIDSADTKSYK